MTVSVPVYVLGVAIGATVVPYFVLYLVFVLVTRKLIPVPYLLGGIPVAVGLTFAINALARQWLGEELLKTPVPMFSGLIVAGAVISALGKWKGRPTSGQG